MIKWLSNIFSKIKSRSDRVPFNWRAPHHLYLGLFLIFFGWTMQPYPYYDLISPYFLYVGLFIVIDDVIEHTVYKDTLLRILFEKMILPKLKKDYKKIK